MNSEEPTLLTHLEEVRRRATGKNDGILSCVVYAGKTKSESDLVTSLLVHRTIVEEEVNEEDANVTGLLMGQGTSVLHLLEGPPHSILRILRKMSQHDDFSNGTQGGRIVYCVEDCPERIYPEWYSCSLQERKQALEEITPETVNDLMFDVSNSLFEVGKILQTTPHENVQMSQFGETLPAKNLIIGLAESDEFFKLSEFVEQYTDPYNVTLESDQVWPMTSIQF
jgi:hypothetical protein